MRAENLSNQENDGTNRVDISTLITSLVRDVSQLQHALIGTNKMPNLTLLRSVEEPPHNEEFDNGVLRKLKHYLKARRRRQILFPEGLFADPAWDILLDLYVVRLEGREISISSSCIASCVPATTALRWLKTLEERGLIFRRNDKFDKRRIYIRLSDTTASLIDTWVTHMFSYAKE